MSKRLVAGFAIVFVLTPTSFLRANGFSLFEVSARAASLGGAFVGRVDDCTAVYYNPAGLVFLRGFRLKANLMFDYLKTTAHDPESGLDFKSNTRQIRGAYFINWGMFDWLSVGLGGFNPYFTDMEWPWSWPGRTLAQSGTLDCYYLRPTVAVKVFRGLALGLGLDLVKVDASWTHVQAFRWGHYYGMFTDSRITASGKGTGFTAGLLWKINEGLRFGAKYQQKVSVDMKGHNRFYYMEAMDTLYLPNLMDAPNPIYPPTTAFRGVQTLTSKMTLPAELAVGVFYAPVNKLAFSLDLQQTKWSQLGGLEFKLNYTEADRWAAMMDQGTPDISHQRVDLDMKDTWKIKFGLEYYLSQYFSLRSGYSYNKSSVPGNLTHPFHPDFNQSIVSLGLGYEGPFFSYWSGEKAGNLSFDLFFQYLISGAASSSTAPGYNLVYDGDRWIVGLGFGVGF
jgi:long-chain fatty acid transport protein